MFVDNVPFQACSSNSPSRLLVPTANSKVHSADAEGMPLQYVLVPGNRALLAHDRLTWLGMVLGGTLRSNSVFSADVALPLWCSLSEGQPSTESLADSDGEFLRSLQSLSAAAPLEDHGMLEAAWNECRESLRRIPLSNGEYVDTAHLLAGLPHGTAQAMGEYIARCLAVRSHESETAHSIVKEGFFSVVPRNATFLFSPVDFQKAICGDGPSIDVELLKRNTRYRIVDGTEAHIRYFWEVLEEFSQADRRAFLRFAWGSDRLPPSSHFPESAQMKIFPSAYDGTEGLDGVLPEAETCFFILKLPRYGSKAVLKKNLMDAIYGCKEINY